GYKQTIFKVLQTKTKELLGIIIDRHFTPLELVFFSLQNPQSLRIELQKFNRSAVKGVNLSNLLFIHLIAIWSNDLSQGFEEFTDRH
ncbi:MAG: hypothetical protein U9N34_02885, partial [Candidatus Cloacimonadota bacterium]|nr:hypothetical protein [Candidatus Cloacimonadota bacterium]